MRAGLASLAAKAAKSLSSTAAKSKASAANVAPSPAATSKGTSSNKQKAASADMAPKRKIASPVCDVSSALSSVIGVSEASRNDAIKGLWIYIKQKNLQNQLDKKEVLCDDKLKAAFGQDKFTINEVFTLMSPHLTKKN